MSDTTSIYHEEHGHLLRLSRTALLAKRDEATQNLRQLHTAINATAPVNGLPNELLVEIFLYVSHFPARWYRLMSVCRYWREVTLAAPRLWANIDLTVLNNPEFLCLHLERSAGAPLNIEARLRLPFQKIQRGFTIKIEDIFSALSPHGHRIQTLELINVQKHELTSISRCLSFDMPHLSVLRIKKYHPGGRALHVPRPDRIFPCLRILELDHLVFPSNSPILSNLVELRLEYSLELHSTNIHSILGIFDRCPALEVLELSYCGPNLGNDTLAYPEPARVLSVPHLRILSLSCTPVNAAYLLAHLVLPPNVHLSVEPVIRREADQDLDISIVAGSLPRDCSRLANLADVDHLHLDILSKHFEVLAHSSHGERPGVRLQIDCIAGADADFYHLYPTALRELAQLCSSAPVTELEINCDQNYIDSDDWQLALDALPRLEVLHIGLYGPVTPLFVALHTPTGDPAHSVRVPRLRELEINEPVVNDTMAEIMLECLGWRAQRDTRLSALTIRNEELYEGPLSSDTIENVQALVDQFTYDRPQQRAQ